MNSFPIDYIPQPDPAAEFSLWFEKAKQSGELEPTAMSLATVDRQQTPRVRIVLCKEFSPQGFVFYTNYESNKAQELEMHSNAAICFHWRSLELQVRVEGRVQKTTRQESEKYFSTRPRESQIGAWASAQSRVLNSRKDLLAKYKEFEEKFKAKPIVCPPYWGGYRLQPDFYEFWIGEPGRLHNRFQFTKDKRQGWLQNRLSP